MYRPSGLCSAKAPLDLPVDGIELATYVAATAIGIIPGSFVFAYAGRQLGMINSLREIASPNVLLAFTLLGLLALVPIIYKKFTERKAA